MGSKLLWLGLTVTLILNRTQPSISFVGVALMAVGVVALWLDR